LTGRGWNRIGFFDGRRRFWTTRDFPQAPEVRQRITRFIFQHRDSGATGGVYCQHALQELNSDPDYLELWSRH
jgi:hypothetical protein